MTPIAAIAMVGIAPGEAGAASGLFNMMRNLGGAIGTAAIETLFTHREQDHSAMITPKVSLLQPATRDRLAELQHYFMAHGYPDPSGAMHRATIAVGQTIRAQATIMGYADSFAFIGVVLLTAVLAAALLPKGASAGTAAHIRALPALGAAAFRRARVSAPLSLKADRAPIVSPGEARRGIGGVAGSGPRLRSPPLARFARGRCLEAQLAQ